ncbi:sorbitol dehydrogenase-like [Antedon mediterranea]|uniref:sorbitol dehydrogenase-like n=1 Tax=Antedon mediterranea TaxID=105859 RepID=UPI003AF91115
MSNTCATLYGDRILELDERPIPNPGKRDVLLLIKSVGICGSDLKYWAYGRCGRFLMESPMVTGHEASGVVVKLGKDVTTLQIGDRVAIEPGIPCRTCDLCKRGRYNLCTDVIFCATPPVDGNLCQFYTHPADFCYNLPDNISFDEGALLEPLSVAVYGCERGLVGLGSTVLVCGAGPVGLLTMMTAKAMGAEKVIITDIDDHRLLFAKRLGADCTLKVPIPVDEKKFAEEVKVQLGCAPDVSIECSGADSSLTIAIYVTKAGGSVVLIGRGSMEPTIPLTYAAVREIDIKGVFRYANSYPKALSLLTSGKIDVKSLISHRFALTQSQQAFETAVNRESKAIKVIITCEN